jgi:hypothetical protein
LISYSVIGQQNIYFNNFENGFNWNVVNSGNNNNHWVCGTQAGNSTYNFGGTHAIYIVDTSGNYNYVNSNGTPETTLVFTQINSLGLFGDTYLDFDIHGKGDNNYDWCRFVYRKNNPTVLTGWYESTNLRSSIGWQHLSFYVPPSITYFQNSLIYIGFMFSCNNDSTFPPSWAIDNVRIWTTFAPLSIDTTQHPVQNYVIKRDNPIEAIYNLNGQVVSDTTNGFFIVRRKYSTEKIIK